MSTLLATPRPKSLDFLPYLARVFSFPRRDFEDIFSVGVDAIIEAGEHAVSVVFKDIRGLLANGLKTHEEVTGFETLAGVIGTGITLLEALRALADSKNVSAEKRQKISFLLSEYRNIFEDIALFSGDISADDCFRAACAGSPWASPEEDAAWRDL
jgi:hypothetical protein